MVIKNTLPVLFIFITAFFIAIIPDVSALSVNLTIPDDAYSSPSKNVTFGCNATDENLTNVTFFLWDSNDSIYYTNTRGISGTFNETNWTVNDTLPDDYYWNCLAYDNESNSAWSAVNMTLHVNLFNFFEQSGELDDTYSVVIADLDNDGDMDYISGNYNDPNRIYMNNGTGNFTLFESSAESDQTRFIAIADLDNDGDMDYIAGNYQQPNSIYLNNGTGNFTLADTNTETGSEPTRSIAVADIDNDGDLDYASVENSGIVRIYKNDDGLANFTIYQNITAENNLEDIAMGDIDGDGYADMVISGIDPQPTKIYFNNGSGYFDYNVSLSDDTNYTQSVVIGDLDNDGDLDIVTGNRNNQPNRVYLNDGTGVFSFNEKIGTGYTRSLVAADLNNDGCLDLIEGNDGNDVVFINNCSGSFVFFESISDGNSRGVAHADIDNDGDIDYLVGRAGTTNMAYLNSMDDSNYIKVYVEGKGISVNRDGIGTKLELADTAGNLLVFREILSDSAHGGTSEMHFGTPSGPTYTINATLITNKVVSCTVQAPKSFRVYENGSSTNGVSCYVVDFPPEIIIMEPSDGNVSISTDVNFSCNASDDNRLTSLTISVWNSTNDLYDQTMRSVSGTSNFTYLFSQSIVPDTYRWNCRACDNASKCTSRPSNYTLSVLITNRLNIKLVLDDASNKVYIPGKGETDSATADYHYGKPPHFYLASYLNNVVTSLVFGNRIPRLIETGSGGGNHHISLEQDIDRSQVFLVFTQGDWKAVGNRIETIERGSFTQNPLPSFSYGLGKGHSTEISLYYDHIDLMGVLNMNRGSHQIVLENNGTSAGRPLIILKRG